MTDAASRQAHWDHVYRQKAETAVSWFQENPAPSLTLLKNAHLPEGAAMIDVGGGASRVVDRLLEDGAGDLTVLDISQSALSAAQRRIGRASEAVTWLCADLTDWRPRRRYDVWHDRAVFHFFTDPADRDAYISALEAATGPGATVIIATFAPDGPERCSGLPIVRYAPQELSNTLGDRYRLVETLFDAHTTPGGSTQRFQFSRFQII